MLKKKFTETKGSSFIMVIFLLTLFTTISIMVVNQLGNQIKSTTNRHDDIQAKYTAEAGIERTIKEVCDEINKKLSSTESVQQNNIQKAYLNQENYAYKSSNIDNIQKELSNIKDNLNSISSKINTQDLNNINSKIDSIRFSDSMIDDIDSIRNDILNIAKNSNNYNEIENTIYSCMEHIYKATDLAYIEKNKNVEPVPLKEVPLDNNQKPWEVRNNNAEEIRQIIEGTKFGNNCRNIASKLNHLYNNEIKNIADLENWQNESDKLFEDGLKIYEDFNKDESDKTIQLIYGYREILYNENLSSEKIIKKLNEINSSIEGIITKINKLQSDLNKFYLNNIDKYQGDSLKKAVDNTLKGYDNIKNEIRWLQKKLDLTPLNSGSSGNTGTGGNSGSNGESGAGGSSGSNTITINLNEYTKVFEDFQNTNRKYKYEIQYVGIKANEDGIVEKDIIVNKDEDNNILNVENLVLEIISNAYKENDDLVYKIKSKIIFKIDVNNGVNVEYDIESYGRIQ